MGHLGVVPRPDVGLGRVVGPEFRAILDRVKEQLGHAGPQRIQPFGQGAARAAPQVDHVVVVAQAHEQRMGAGNELHRPHVRVQERDVDAPDQRLHDLCAPLGLDVGEVGAVPHLGGRARHEAFPVMQGGGSRERAPAVAGILAGERQVNADPAGGRPPHGVQRPGAGDHERGAGGDASVHDVMDRPVGCGAGPQVVAVDDQQLRVGRVPQAFGEARHRPNLPSPSARA